MNSTPETLHIPAGARRASWWAVQPKTDDTLDLAARIVQTVDRTHPAWQHAHAHMWAELAPAADRIARRYGNEPEIGDIARRQIDQAAADWPAGSGQPFRSFAIWRIRQAAKSQQISEIGKKSRRDIRFGRAVSLDYLIDRDGDVNTPTADTPFAGTTVIDIIDEFLHGIDAALAQVVCTPATRALVRRRLLGHTCETLAANRGVTASAVHKRTARPLADTVALLDPTTLARVNALVSGNHQYRPAI